MLGAAAGGGFPQWNSAGPGCLRARAGDPAAPPRTQAGIAASADGERWLLINASPDLRQQIAQTPALHPRPGKLRNSPIEAVLLTGAEVDALAGLLHLRERQAFELWAAPPAQAVLEANPIFGALNRETVTRRTLPLEEGFTLLGMRITAYPVPGKVPLFAEGTGFAGDAEEAPVAEAGEALGVALSAGGGTLHVIPGCAMMSAGLRERLRGADAVLFDGTLFTDDEMLRLGAGPKTGRRMGHMPMTGEGGTLDAFADLGVRRRVFVHINNTNPALLADSPERAHLAAAGWEVAEDGMEILV